jgi:predicted ATP-binding protein involved in virulence
VWSPEANSDFYKHVTNWREVVGLPVQTIEELFDIGEISEEKLQELRQECLDKYKNDPEYHKWYNSFFIDNGGVIPIEELLNIPTPILDINAIIKDCKTDRSHYDQELDNKFISGQNRAIGEFIEEDIPSPDLEDVLKNYKQQIIEEQKPPPA